MSLGGIRSYVCPACLMRLLILGAVLSAIVTHRRKRGVLR
jgi:hypothetical protein